MSASRRLRSPLQAATVETIVGLLWTTGLRVGEAIRLDNTDLDASTEALAVRGTKNLRSRIVPIEPSTHDALRAYMTLRDELAPNAERGPLFVSTVGKRVLTGNLGAAFASVVELAGLPTRRAGVGPCLGGLRHSFAVQTLLEWHQAGLDVGSLLPRLSTYLGHGRVARGNRTPWLSQDRT